MKRNKRINPVIQANYALTRKPNRRKLDLVDALVKVLAIALLILACVGLTILIAQGSTDTLETTVKLYLIFGMAASFWAMR